MRFVWPQQTHPFPTLLGRLGRLVHWLGLALYGGLGLMIVFGPPAPTNPQIILMKATAALGVFACYLLARGLRFVLSGE